MQVEHLTLGLAIVDPFASQAWLGKAAGYFADAGLDLDIKILGSAVVAGVVSGNADLVMSGLGTSLPLPRDGKEVSWIYAYNGNGSAAWMAGTVGVRSAQDCKRMVTAHEGTVAYQWAVQMKKWFNASYELVPIQDSGAAGAAIGSPPDNNCGTNAYSLFAPFIASGKLHVIFDPTNPATFPPAYVPGMPEGGVWGLKSAIASKRSAVQKFLKAMDRVRTDALKKRTPEELATLMRKNQEFQTYTQDALASYFKTVAFSWTPNDGYIPSSVWNPLITFIHDGGTTFADPADPKFSYSALVDMSYYDAAIGKPAVR